MKLRAVLFALALAACGQSAEKAPAAPAAPEHPDPATLQIEIGRYGAMLYQVRDLTAERPGAVEVEPTTQRELSRNLREAVWEYNVERSRLCGKGLFTDVACGAAYEPVWISEPADAEPSLEEIQSRADAVGEEVQRFWGAVCDDARTRETNEDNRSTICAME